MDPKALEKADSRLQVAREMIDELKVCKDHKTFSGRWYVFLMTCKNVYTALEQGAKVSAPSRQWFGARKQERKNDPLLQYLFQARDDDEHGLGPVSEHIGDNIKLGPGGNGFSTNVKITYMEGGIVELKGMDGLPVAFEHEPAHFRLRAVIGRGPVVYAPPVTHKGQPISDTSPVGVAELAFAHLSALVEDARKLA